MKKFRYPMQSILEIKRKLEDQERSNYAAAQMRLNAENEKLAELSARREEYEERLRDTVGNFVGPDVDEILRILVGCHHHLKLRGSLFVLRIRDGAHNTGNALQHVDRRIMVPVRQISGQDNMSVQNTACRIRDRLIEIVAVHKYGIKPCNRPLRPVASAFKKLGGEDRHGNCRIFPGSGKGCTADDGFAHPVFHGAEGNRPHAAAGKNADPLALSDRKHAVHRPDSERQDIRDQPARHPIGRLGSVTVLAEVTGFRDGRLLLMPYEDVTGIGEGSMVVNLREPLQVPVGPELLGQTLDGLGHPLDGGRLSARF